MKTGSAGLTLLKGFEKCCLAAYLDGGGVWTQGWGHTGAGVDPCREWTQDEADSWLAKDLTEAETEINHVVAAPLNQNQFDALVCFVYNIGGGQFEKSTLLKYLNLQKYALANSEFLKWNHDNGIVSLGLTRRRQAERNLFLTPA